MVRDASIRMEHKDAAADVTPKNQGLDWLVLDAHKIIEIILSFVKI